MNNPIRLLIRRHICGAALMAGLLTGCSGDPSYQDPSWTMVPIRDVSAVAGEWEGTVKQGRALLPEKSIHLILRENGTYTFVGHDLEDVIVGTGTLEARDGRLTEDSDRRSVTVTLYDRKGKPTLAVQATNRETGIQRHGLFTKVQK